MRRFVLPAVFLSLIVAVGSTPLSTRSVSAAAAMPTFNKDVLPILQKNCQECHRPGAIAPMSFLTYSDARPYARAIAKAVTTRSMPPWFADPAIGRFKNARVLSDGDIATISDWAEKGAVEGDPADRRAPVEFGDGWTIGKPDIVVTMPANIELPATGIIDQSNAGRITS
jgi:mono/diheme cytochrome c family protein